MNSLIWPVAATIIAVLYGIYWPSRNPSIMRTIAKTLPLLLIGIYSYLSGNLALLTIAFVLSAFGDAFLSRDGELPFIFGLGSFLFAHIAFAILFYSISPAVTINSVPVIAMIIGLILLMSLVLLNLWPNLGVMKLPVLLYAVAIATMAFWAWSSDMGAILYVGVGLFVFSDIVLAHGLFYWRHDKTKIIANYVVWVSYFIAQMLILAAFY